MDGSAREGLRRVLEEAQGRLQEAIAKVDSGDLDEVDALVMEAQGALAEGADSIARHQQADDTSFLEDFSRRWFRESEVMRALFAELEGKPIMSEGVYLWRVRQTSHPPLSMPSEYEGYRHGPVGTLEVSCNTQHVTFEVRVADSGEKG